MALTRGVGRSNVTLKQYSGVVVVILRVEGLRSIACYCMCYLIYLSLKDTQQAIGRNS